jgi:hypothetical protein
MLVLVAHTSEWVASKANPAPIGSRNYLKDDNNALVGFRDISVAWRETVSTDIPGHRVSDGGHS